MRQSISKIAVSLFLLPSIALAHAGIGETSGFMHGFGHPLGGVDHLLAMIAVGLWAAQIGGRAFWVVPTTFVSAMIFGGILGFTGIAVSFIEEGVLLSVLVLGILIAGAFKLPLVYSALIVGIFAIFHGNAHGAEMPVAMDAVSYTLGFALTTAMLHLAGIGLGALFQKTNTQVVNRFAGGAIVVAGLYLSIS